MRTCPARRSSSPLAYICSTNRQTRTTAAADAKQVRLINRQPPPKQPRWKKARDERHDARSPAMSAVVHQRAVQSRAAAGPARPCPETTRPCSRRPAWCALCDKSELESAASGSIIWNSWMSTSSARSVSRRSPLSSRRESVPACVVDGHVARSGRETVAQILASKCGALQAIRDRDS